jgi:hypothetical protein
MPSIVIGQPLASGPQVVLSGAVFSGSQGVRGGVAIRLSRQASGAVYIGFSGGLTQNSGGMQLSGGWLSGKVDGYEVGPGQEYFVPKLALPSSGFFNIWARHDAECSGLARLYFEIL